MPQQSLVAVGRVGTFSESNEQPTSGPCCVNFEWRGDEVVALPCSATAGVVVPSAQNRGVGYRDQGRQPRAILELPCIFPLSQPQIEAGFSVRV